MNKIKTTDELYYYLEKELKIKYGENPEKFVIKRFEDEMDYIKKEGADIHLIKNYNILRELIANNIPFWILGKIGRYFLAYLLNLTSVNPLPVHYYCCKCKYHKKAFEVDCGFDLPSKKCPVCGSKMIGEGHNLNYLYTLTKDIKSPTIYTCDEGVKEIAKVTTNEYDAVVAIPSDSLKIWYLNPSKELLDLATEDKNEFNNTKIKTIGNLKDYSLENKHERVWTSKRDTFNELYKLLKENNISIREISIYGSFSEIISYLKLHKNELSNNIDFMEELLKSNDNILFYDLVKAAGKHRFKETNIIHNYDIFDEDSVYNIVRHYPLFSRSHNIDYILMLLKLIVLKTKYISYNKVNNI